jgi:hypothetical protein
MSSLFGWTKAACLLLLASEAFASPIEKIEQLEKRAVCTAYSMSSYQGTVSSWILTLTQALLETRGTNEPQGPSNSFKTMNAAIIAQVMGGTEVCVSGSVARESY